MDVEAPLVENDETVEAPLVENDETVEAPLVENDETVELDVPVKRHWLPYTEMLRLEELKPIEVIQWEKRCAVLSSIIRDKEIYLEDAIQHLEEHPELLN